jgi:hypothetical protein
VAGSNKTAKRSDGNAIRTRVKHLRQTTPRDREPDAATLGDRCSDQVFVSLCPCRRHRSSAHDELLDQPSDDDEQWHEDKPAMRTD